MYKLFLTIEDAVQKYIEESNVVEIGSLGLEELGLDFRCGCILISEEEGFVATANPRSIEYYGGWEYIDSEYKLDAGNYRFYDREASRVDIVFRRYRELVQNGYRYEEGKGFVNSNRFRGLSTGLYRHWSAIERPSPSRLSGRSAAEDASLAVAENARAPFAVVEQYLQQNILHAFFSTYRR